MDVMGQEYTEQSLQFYRAALPCDEKEMKFLLMKLFHHLQLLSVTSNSGGKFKTYAINSAIQRALINLAGDFNLTNSIHDFLIKGGFSKKRIYRVSDLRKFSDYARILGYKDNKRYKPDKLISFVLPVGWLVDYNLVEKPILPHGADMKLRDADYILDNERYIPPEIKEAYDQALYWEIVEFQSDYSEKPIR
jgi:hypothetical protein